ncbi:MAG: BREX-1 system adenine-specific DNA-methyltransferase PglX [Actinobacteria bacterium]|nr:BREX-1 system adenine-specific DNA-methyltransferase PglX [Actinomycetota bacterium]
MKDEYPTGKADLMTAFMLKAEVLTKPGGTWGMINLPSWMSLKSFENMRHDLLLTQRIASMVHLGRGVFGSDFGSVAFVVANAKGDGGRAVYRRLFEQHVDVRSVATIEALFLDRDYNRFEIAQSDFAAIPGSPIVYWLSEKMRAAFKVSDRLDSLVITEGQHKTADNDRYLRYGWEVSRSLAGHQARWIPYAKGGPFRRWFGNIDHLVDWSEAARSHYRLNAACRITDPQFWYLPGITWTDITSGGSSFRWMPAGGTFDMSGPVAYLAYSNDYSSVLGILNSAFATDVFRILNSTFHLQLRDVRALPMPPEPVGSHEISHGVDRMVSVSRDDWNSFETAWSFTKNPLIRTFQSATSERPPRVDSN